MAKQKDKFHGKEKQRKFEAGELPEEEKTLAQKGVTLDGSKVKIGLKDVVVTKDELYDQIAKDWSTAEAWGSRLSPKRKLRVLEKAITAPVFPDHLIPLRPNDKDEANYFLALQQLQDTRMYLVEVLYSEMEATEAAKKEAKENEKV